MNFLKKTAPNNPVGEQFTPLTASELQYSPAKWTETDLLAYLRMCHFKSGYKAFQKTTPQLLAFFACRKDVTEAKIKRALDSLEGNGLFKRDTKRCARTGHKVRYFSHFWKCNKTSSELIDAVSVDDEEIDLRVKELFGFRASRLKHLETVTGELVAEIKEKNTKHEAELQALRDAHAVEIESLKHSVGKHTLYKVGKPTNLLRSNNLDLNTNNNYTHNNNSDLVKRVNNLISRYKLRVHSLNKGVYPKLRERLSELSTKHDLTDNELIDAIEWNLKGTQNVAFKTMMTNGNGYFKSKHTVAYMLQDDRIKVYKNYLADRQINNVAVEQMGINPFGNAEQATPVKTITLTELIESLRVKSTDMVYNIRNRLLSHLERFNNNALNAEAAKFIELCKSGYYNQFCVKDVLNDIPREANHV